MKRNSVVLKLFAGQGTRRTDRQTKRQLYASPFGLHVWLMWRSWVQAPSKAPVVSLSKKLHSYYLVLVGSRNGFKR